MKKKFLLLTSLLCSFLMFTSCMFIVTEGDITSAKAEVNCKYTISDGTTTFTWQMPSSLSGKVQRFYISENSSSKLTETMTAYIVDEIYRDSSYSDRVSIKSSVTRVVVNWHAWTSENYYLWAELTDDVKYNLGKFTTIETDRDRLKAEIRLHKNYIEENNETVFEWNVPSYINFNPMRFMISEEDRTKYNSTENFSCVVVDPKYRNDYYNDKVSISLDVRKPSTGSYDNYGLIISGNYKNKRLYLWTQLEDGNYYNLGEFTL